MIKPRNFVFTILSLGVIVLLSSWGTVGHKKINLHAPASFPHAMEFLKADWTVLLPAHGSDADKRKAWDPDEEPKHFIDIDNYPEFVQYGKISQTYDSVVALHGGSFVLDNGTLPWATVIAFDSLKSCFQRRDWTNAGLFAADLGHYVGDGHQPLHITRNYNGQYTGQDEVHSRYESHLIGSYQGEILYDDDSAEYIKDVRNYVFSYLYHNYLDLDSLLTADSAAYANAGYSYSSQYYSLFWASSKNFTIDLFKRASYSLASLIYTAWVDAGSPNTTNAMNELSSTPMLRNYPNPFKAETMIRFEVHGHSSQVQLQVCDMTGNVVSTLADGILDPGIYEIGWNAAGSAPGVYYIRLKTEDRIETVKAVLIR